MINNLLFISLAPVLIIAFYIYNRDKYEKEPYSILFKALMIGILIVLPVFLIEKFLTMFFRSAEGLSYAAYTAFVVAGLTEEAMKFLGFYFFFWKDRNFNEKFDGIVYAVYISLGFAAIENILYVFTGGAGVGIVRALTAVPAHALFGIVMGYYFGLARFSESHRRIYLTLAFFMAVIFHGLYDFLLMSNSQILLTAFIPVFIYFWIGGFRKMAVLSNASVFREVEGKQDSPVEYL
ncbi:MAG: PrsW family glutamic-type intramembrane protease [Bacteroidales bacterium]|jgi:RsiW-degrading membrane proteinase PrsW (M82 family)|nr:PrsW family glutamic-type intramembrane protease [Bacteroidales bacterium]